MHALIAFCVRRCGPVTALLAITLIYGGWLAMSSPLDVFPEFVPSQVDIQTEAPGFTPEQVEQLVTKRVESAVNGVPGLATIRSESIPGLSVVTVTFNDSIDVHLARQGLSERLSELGATLPTNVGPPRLSALVSSTMDLLKIGLVSDRLDAFALRDTADWLIKPALLAVPGVAHVVNFGGAVRQIHITPDTAKLVAYGLTLTQVADAARAALDLRGAGFVDLAAQRILITLPTPTPDLGVLRQTVVSEHNGAPILLGDVAQVAEGAALRSGDSLIMGKPGVLISLASQYGANTLATTLAVERVLDDLKPALETHGITVYPAMHRPANFIERALGELERSLLIASGLILLVLYAFMRDLRAAFIAFIAIPLSLLAAVLVLDKLGYTLNTMTLGGFAVALGVLVDDGIIDIENILRRLRLNRDSATPLPRLDVIRDASFEVRAPVIFATLVAIAVFLPELFAGGVQGRFVGPLALAFILAVSASLLVAMIATPALCALLLRNHSAHDESRWMRGAKRLQARCIAGVIAHRRLTMAALLLLIGAALASVPFLGGTFMPEFREGHLVVQTSSLIPGTSLDEMMQLGERVSAEMLHLPYVKTIEQQLGRAELGEDTWGVHQSEFHVELDPNSKVDQAKAQEDLRAIMQHYPGIQSEVVTFLGDRISESLTGDTAQVAVKVVGDDLDELDRIGGRIAAILKSEPGVIDLQYQLQRGTPTLSIELLPQALAAAALTPQNVFETVQSSFAGQLLGQTFNGTRVVDAVMILPDDLRRRPEQIGALMITSPYGPLRLSQVARLRVTTSRYDIQHEAGQRRIAITFNVTGGALQATVAHARERITRAVNLPAGYFVNFTGAAADEVAARKQLLLYAALSLALIIMLLFVAFKWRTNAWLVLANVPFSLIGGIAAIAATGIGMSLGSIVGLVTVFGISARNTLLQLSHYEHLVLVEGATWNVDTVMRGANERLLPIIMTASVTALGLAPLAANFAAPGQEIEGPMAVTVLGGLLSSTLLNLLILPALAELRKAAGTLQPLYLGSSNSAL